MEKQTKTMRSLEQWLEIAVMHKLISQSDADRIAVYVEQDKEEILRDEKSNTFLYILDWFYWENTEEGYEYWDNVQKEVIDNPIYNYLDLTCAIVIEEDTVSHLEQGFQEFVHDNYDIITSFDQAGSEYPIELIYAGELMWNIDNLGLTVYEIIHPSDLFIIKNAIKVLDEWADEIYENTAGEVLS